MTQLAFCEPAEREDPRNALLDTMTAQIIEMLESAVRNEVHEILLSRIASAAPALFSVLEPAIPTTIPAPAPASCGSQEAAPAAVPARVHPDAELRLAKVLAGLKLGHPKTPAARELLDGAKMIVLADMAALRAVRSLIGARCSAVPGAAPEVAGGFTFVISDVGSGA